jgi:hypothetical protein
VAEQRSQIERTLGRPTEQISDAVSAEVLEAARNRLRQLTGEQDGWATAAALLSQKLSPTSQDSETWGNRIVQYPGE